MRKHLFTCLSAVVLCAGMTGCSPEAKKARNLEKAGKYFSAGEFEKAKVEYLNVLQMDPQSGIATERLGLIWYEQGAFFRAFPFLLKSRTQMPGNYDTRTKLALSMLQVGRFREARNEAQTVLKESSSPNEAFLILAETIRTGPEIEATAEAIKKSSAAQSPWGLVASAKLQLLKGDFPGANDLLQRAVRADPKAPVAHAGLAEYYFRQGDAAKAKPELRQAAELAPVRSITRIRFAEFQLQSGAGNEAAASLKELLRQAPDYLPAKRLQAQIAFTEKKYDDAQTLLKEIFAIDAANIEGHILLSQILMTKGDFKQAIQNLEALSKAQRGFAQVNFQLARAHVFEGHAERAIPVLESGIRDHPEHVESVLMLAELNLRAGKAPVVMGDMVALLQQQPSLVPAQNLLINSLRLQGRLDDATKVVREQVRLMPQNPEPHIVLGTLLLQQKNATEARAEFEKAQSLAPDLFPALAALVDLDVREKNFTSAMRRVDEQKAKRPGLAELYYLEGNIFMAQQQWTNAETALHKALELKPELTGAYELLLQTYTASNNLPKAIQQLEETLTRKPNDRQARLLSGIIYEQMKDYTKAKDAYEQLLKARPDDTMALNNLAWMSAEHLNQLDRALELAEKARSLQPDSPAVADTLGWILLKRKEYPRALELIREGATKQPDNPEMQYHLALAYQATGDNEAARVAYEKAASAPTEFRGKSEIKERLAALAKEPAKGSTPTGEKAAK